MSEISELRVVVEESFSGLNRRLDAIDRDLLSLARRQDTLTEGQTLLLKRIDDVQKLYEIVIRMQEEN